MTTVKNISIFSWQSPRKVGESDSTFDQIQKSKLVFGVLLNPGAPTGSHQVKSPPFNSSRGFSRISSRLKDDFAMIPIQCPKCGRTGNVPPDRLNARLVCKGCHSAFHMDNGGRMVLGEAGSPAAAKSWSSTPSVEIDLAQTWRDFPKPAKYGVPAAFVLLTGWMLFPDLSSGVPYQDQAEVVGRALVNGDRSRVVASATSDTAEAAGQWYDLVRAPIVAKGAGAVANDAIRASLLNGNPEHDAEVSLAVSVASDALSTSFTLQMINKDGLWKLDGTKSLTDAMQMAQPLKLAKKR